MLAAAERQTLVQVRNAEVVDVHHPAVELRGDGEALSAARAKYGGAQAIGRTICERNRLTHRVVAHHQENRGEELLLCDFHVGRDMRQERRGKVVAERPAGVAQPVPAMHEFRAVPHRILN